jgi:hypothetical protein
MRWPRSAGTSASPQIPVLACFDPYFGQYPDKRAFARYGFFWPVGAAVFASPLPTSPLPPARGSWIWLFIPKMPFFDFSPGVVGGAAPVENLPVGLVGPALAVVASAMEPSTATARGAAISLVILGPGLVPAMSGIGDDAIIHDRQPPPLASLRRSG